MVTGIGFRRTPSLHSGIGIRRTPSSGETGIRTPDTLLTYTRFPGVPLQPLEHLSFLSSILVALQGDEYLALGMFFPLKRNDNP